MNDYLNDEDYEEVSEVKRLKIINDFLLAKMIDMGFSAKCDEPYYDEEELEQTQIDLGNQLAVNEDLCEKLKKLRAENKSIKEILKARGGQ